MLTQVKNAKFYLQAKLGLSQRGAEMVEYAIVLACVAAVAAVYYISSGTANTTLSGAIKSLWDKISTNISKVSQ